MVMHKMSYRDSNDNLEFIPVSVANSAFDQALNQVAKTKGEIPAELDFSNTASYKNKSNSQRQIIYSVLEKAIQNLSANESISFADTYDAEPSPTPPGPTPKPLYTYPDGIGKYVNGTVVKDGDSNYQCLVANWCNTPAYSPTGSFADSAWKNLNPQPEPTPQGDWSPKKTYNEGDTVSIKSIEYRANFWNQNKNPENYNCQYGCEWTIFN